MANISTNLMSTLLNNESIDEVFRSELENTVNKVLSTELTSFLDYKKYDYSSRNSGDSRNGFYDRTYQSRFGTPNLKIPRDCEGLFKQHTVPSYQRSSNELETTIIQLYKKGITSLEISDLIEKMYGHYYTPQTVSNITTAVQNQLNDSITVLFSINM
ncbi:Transposase, Mutator family [Lachnospiraceae bacterium KH1T2]|nr:Transposase, Mutator family [Lachnospiraceae bacterium KH1T2]